jgi:tetratricopeptide (TPR) repeat protein
VQGLTRIRAGALGALVGFALGCGGTFGRAPASDPAAAPAPAEAPAAAAAAGDRKAQGLEATLGELADRALAEGAIDRAGERYTRMLASDPSSLRAHVGLGRVALARGDPAAARPHFEAALALDPASAEARLGMADTAAGDPAEARAHLERALATAPGHAGVHERLADLTGRAPHPARSLDEAIELASLHPYDPQALLDAGRRLAEADRGDEAARLLEGVLALADLDLAAADAAAALLPQVEEGWRARRVVPVYVFLDAPLRSQPGWRFRQRQLWLDLSAALDPLLATRFVVVSVSPFDGAPEGTRLAARLVALMHQTSEVAQPGIFAAFTAERSVRVERGGDGTHGIADYLGRHLIVRDAPGGDADRVLAHELLHLYGGIHVVDEVDSLMNPDGDSRRLDPLSGAIARSLAPRRFGPLGFDANVVPHVDLAAATAAYEQALRTNLAYRELGLAELLGDATAIGPGAHWRVQQVTRLDAHLGDVSRIVSRLYWASGRRVESVAMLELASQLYGRQTPEGRTAFARAEGLRRLLAVEYGVE